MKQQVTYHIIIYHLLLGLARLAHCSELADGGAAAAAANHKMPHAMPGVGGGGESSPIEGQQQSDSEAADHNSEPTEPPSVYQPPEELEVIRMNDTVVVLRWDINHVSMDHLQFFKTQYKSTKKNAQWKTDQREIPPTSRAHQISGLRPGNYYFIVMAVYDNDDNIESKQLKYTLRARSKIPDSEMPERTAPQIRWSESASDYIRFKWKYPVKERDVPYFGYLVYYRSAHSVSEYNIYNTLEEECEIAELEPDTPYEAKVVAYNQVGISDFSDTITIKTKSKQNSTAPAASTTTTAAPAVTRVTTESTITVVESSATSPNPIETSPTTRPTTKPIDEVANPNDNTTIITPHNLYFSISSLSNVFSQLMTGQDDTTLAIKYSLFFLLPMIVITSILICLISCHRKRKSPDSSSNDSTQSDLDLNPYFKNSFPGVDDPGAEKEFSMMVNLHQGHQGFVNNHPHIDDFA